MRGVLDVVAIKAPGFGTRRKDMLQDIAVATGATYVAEEVRCGWLWWGNFGGSLPVKHFLSVRMGATHTCVRTRCAWVLCMILSCLSIDGKFNPFNN
jgi:hypothetical protein